MYIDKNVHIDHSWRQDVASASGSSRTFYRLDHISLQRAVPQPLGDSVTDHIAFVTRTPMPVPGWELKDRDPMIHWSLKGHRESHLSLGVGLETKVILPAKFSARFHKLSTCMESSPYENKLGGPGSWQRSWRHHYPDSSEPGMMVTR